MKKFVIVLALTCFMVLGFTKSNSVSAEMYCDTAFIACGGGLGGYGLVCGETLGELIDDWYDLKDAICDVDTDAPEE